MPKHSGGLGTFGGVDVLERKPTSDQEEKRESLNLRNPDMLDQVLASILGRKVGGCILGKTFVIEHELARPTDITYDRWYYERELNLLVSFLPSIKESMTDREGIEEQIRELREFAQDHNYRFLAICGGEVFPDQLKELLDYK